MQSFILPANGVATPESIKRKRRMAEAMLSSGVETSPIASPWQGAARMAQALVGGLGSRKADKQEAEGMASARDAMIKALNGGDNAAVIDAVSNPFMDNNSMGLLTHRYGQLNKEPDPMARLITGEEATSMGLPPGAYNLFPDGKISAIGGGDTNVNINNADPNAPMMGTIPQGFMAVKDPANPAGFRMERIPGGPEDNSAAMGEKNLREGVSQALIQDEIRIAKDLIKGESMLSPATGLTGKVASNIDATRAGALKNRLETIKANIGFDRLQAMREASPTGGALGPVSDFENRLLQAVMGSLEQAQDATQVNYNLDRLSRIVDAIVNTGIPADQANAMYEEIVTGQKPGAANNLKSKYGLE